MGRRCESSSTTTRRHAERPQAEGGHPRRFVGAGAYARTRSTSPWTSTPSPRRARCSARRHHRHGRHDRAWCARSRHRPLLPPRVVRAVHAVPRGNRLAAQDPAAASRKAVPARTRPRLLLDVADNMIGNTICVLGDAAAMPVQSPSSRSSATSSKSTCGSAAVPHTRRAATVAASAPRTMPKLDDRRQGGRGQAGNDRHPGRGAAGIEIPHYCYHPACRSPATAACAWSRSRRCRSSRSPATRTSRRHGGPHRERARQGGAASGARVPARQPPDRLPDLRPGRRVQAAGLLHGLRAPAEPCSRSRRRSSKRKASTSAHTVMLDQERCILCTRCVRFSTRSPKTSELGVFDRGDHASIDLVPERSARQRLLRQHRRHLPRGRADQQGLPLQHARLVPEGHRSVCPGCADRLQHRDPSSQGTDLPLPPALQPRGQRLVDV